MSTIFLGLGGLWQAPVPHDPVIQVIKMSDALDDRIPPRPYLRNEVFQVLKSKLMAMSFGATDSVHLREVDLARSLGVSRTPVREALNRLEQEGLVEVIPHRGVRLVPTTVEEYLAWLDIREVLEGLAARAAAERIKPEEVKDLRDIFSDFKNMTAGSGGRDYAIANVRFHAAILDLSGNMLLKRMFRQYDHMEMVELRIVERLGREQDSLREHFAIIDALERKDPVGAEQAARQHVRNLRREAARGLSDLRMQRPGSTK